MTSTRWTYSLCSFLLNWIRIQARQHEQHRTYNWESRDVWASFLVAPCLFFLFKANTTYGIHACIQRIPHPTAMGEKDI